MKKLHKLIMTSSVYREASEVSRDANRPRRRQPLPLALQPPPSVSRRDPRHHAAKFRLLNLKMGGRPVVPEVAREELYGLSGNSMWVPTANQEEHNRRSVYMLVRRTFRPAMFESFDAPDGILSCSRRVESNTAPQSLTLLNGQWTMQEANRLADNSTTSPMTAGWPRKSWQAWTTPSVHGSPRTKRSAPRRPSSSVKRRSWANRRAAVAELCRVLFNTNEFLYVD